MAGDGELPRTGFSDVDAALAPGYCINYLDDARRAPAIIETKRWMMDRLHLGRDQAALDVGCGTGEDVVAMAEAVGPGGTAVGVDASKAMIAEARARHDGLSNVSFKVDDAQSLPFSSGVFDACRAERTLQHLADPDKAVAEMTRVLRPGGRIALTEPDWGTLVVEGSDPEVSSAILAAHVKRHPHPRMGRRLLGLLHANGIAEIELGSQVVMFTDLESARRAFGIARDLSEIVAIGIVGEDRADRWIKDLERADAEHQFFCAVTGFRAAGCKRSDAASR